MAVNMDWAIKLAIEHLIDKLPAENIEEAKRVFAAGLGLKAQLDRIEYTQIELFKMTREIRDALAANADAGNARIPERKRFADVTGSLVACEPIGERIAPERGEIAGAVNGVAVSD
jgi:hypothetical protein